MRQSFLATRVRKEVPVDEVSLNARLLIRAGYIHKTMAGVYSFLPLGLRSLNKIIGIIREEMEGIGGQEVLLNGLQNPEVWEQSGRWRGDADEVWFRTQLRVGGEVGLGWTHEEPITDLARQIVHSYRDVPFYLYQFQTKFRNEERAKSGILRTREFIMKDLYSFCADEEEHKVFYEQCAEAYMRVFERVGIGQQTYRTFASGGAFSEFSDEFQTVLPAGEDVIYVHKEKGVALNKEVYTDAVLARLELQREELEEYPACEVGNIFTLGMRFSDALGLLYTDGRGTQVPVYMGSYGIGPARLLGVIVEMVGSDAGMVLPAAVAPFAVHLIALGESDVVQGAADDLYSALTDRGVEVLYDDRAMSAGEKFAESDIVGIPRRLVVSEKTCAAGKVEYVDRATGEEGRLLDTAVAGILQELSA
ncbi:MAG: His/Gly/Thr/Pro-type tRNA ligase C-terminal domain-containing protein [Candidatus Kaiserbacteria bacterium]|nr:His/Gly/Thr/Pro-type tRNA ligase C-terminal domain-containing protein [Candidatus Kaiserbacteria bacterium]